MSKSVLFLLGVVAFTTMSVRLRALESGMAMLPAQTAVPVRFMKTVDAGKAHSGDPVVARIIQVVRLQDGQLLPKGAFVIGHVVSAQPLSWRSNPQGSQSTSNISIHFDEIRSGSQTIRVNLAVRALASAMVSSAASGLHYANDQDLHGTRILVGGDEISPQDKAIRNNDGFVVGHDERQGLFGPLPSTTDATQPVHQECIGTADQQSLGIFSPSACGIYGFDHVFMAQAGRSGSGTFTLESPQYSVRLYAGSTALLQETEIR